METVFEEIKNALKLVDFEIFDNKIYLIKTKNIDQKEELRSFLNKNTYKEYNTIVEVDLTNEVTKKSKKARMKERNEQKNSTRININSFPSTFDYPIGGGVIHIYNSSLFLYGEYIKLSRNISQSPLFINKEFKATKCVSDFIYEFKDFYKAKEVRFHSTGREDIDVKCLEGRPFVLEIVCPTININKNQMDITLYPEICIKNTFLINKDGLETLKRAEPNKLYNLLVFSNKVIVFEKQYIIQQRTPLRVLHRRANMTRTRNIKILRYEEIKKNDGFYYNIDIETSSGTYIKEWVHGDFDRTTPNLDSDLLELDVIKVDYKLPEERIIRPFELNIIR